MSESCYDNNKKYEIIKFNAAYFLGNPNCNLYISKDLSHHEKIKLIRLLFLKKKKKKKKKIFWFFFQKKKKKKKKKK